MEKQTDARESFIYELTIKNERTGQYKRLTKAIPKHLIAKFEAKVGLTENGFTLINLIEL